MAGQLMATGQRPTVGLQPIKNTVSIFSQTTKYISDDQASFQSPFAGLLALKRFSDQRLLIVTLLGQIRQRLVIAFKIRIYCFMIWIYASTSPGMRPKGSDFPPCSLSMQLLLNKRARNDKLRKNSACFVISSPVPYKVSICSTIQGGKSPALSYYFSFISFLASS